MASSAYVFATSPEKSARRDARSARRQHHSLSTASARPHRPEPPGDRGMRQRRVWALRMTTSPLHLRRLDALQTLVECIADTRTDLQSSHPLAGERPIAWGPDAGRIRSQVERSGYLDQK